MASSKHPRPQRNRAARLALILHRDGAECVWCRRPFDSRLVRPTTEHVVPRIKGGPSWLENEVAACRRCNSARGHRTLGDWSVACMERGWAPNIVLILRRLDELEQEIQRKGGIRRARPYIRAQRRRLSGQLDQDPP